MIARTREGSYLSFSMEQRATIAQHHMDSGRIIRTMLAIEHENPSGGIIG
ncbi:hypothetical protein HMPREF1316_0628 [Olsenella profusa F0195]|uniref:Uncharacterized protein n=1 Tax=Olsenella profusa F0195 TaxID=1125712 RepID=U2V0B1_9ACTN|nr:hypothetical protein HMPREF1316_0628 [Olsenella profusa F0195]